MKEQSGDWFHFRHLRFRCLGADNGKNCKLFGNIEDNAKAPPKCLYNVQNILPTGKVWGGLKRCEDVHTDSDIYMVHIQS